MLEGGLEARIISTTTDLRNLSHIYSAIYRVEWSHLITFLLRFRIRYEKRKFCGSDANIPSILKVGIFKIMVRIKHSL